MDDTHALLGKEHLKDYLIYYSMNGTNVTLLKLYDVYWKYDLTAILIALIVIMVLVSICVILMVRYSRKKAKADIIKSELLKHEQQQNTRKKTT